MYRYHPTQGLLKLSPTADVSYISSIPNGSPYEIPHGGPDTLPKPGYFEIDHIPDQFEYREPQLRELAFSLAPGLQGSRPLNTILRGLPGTGKTTSVHRIFAEVEETTRRLVPVYVNCQNERTRFSVFSRIYLNSSVICHHRLASPSGRSWMRSAGLSSSARLCSSSALMMRIISCPTRSSTIRFSPSSGSIRASGCPRRGHPDHE
jgi:hypothetical protein